MPAQRLFLTERCDNVLIVAPQGDVGSLEDQEIQSDLSELLQQLRTCEPCSVLIDLEHAPYFGSTMLGALIKVWRHASGANGRVALCHVSEFVHDILNVTKLDGVWPVYESRQQALEGLRDVA